MRQVGGRGRRAWAAFGLLAMVTAASAAGGPVLSRQFRPRRAPVLDLPRATVRRADLRSALNASARVDSSNRTTIKCDLENIAVGVRGNNVYASGSSTILELIPDGTRAKEGDVLCRLDASEYEEMYRQQQMNVERVDADFRQAELTLEVARLAVREYQLGTYHQTMKDYEGQMALARSELGRALDRRAWADRMLEKGYVPRSQLLAEDVSVARLFFNLNQARTALDVFRQFSAPRAKRELECQVLNAEVQLTFQGRRRERTHQRLEKLRRQVENCTIRAPHDGFVIYANEAFRNVRIEEGATVRQNQDLFYLPDLSRMEVDALIHESVVNRVDKGMRAKVQAEGLPDRVLEGHVESIAQVPMWNRFSDIRYFVAIVKLDSVPDGLLPGMSAEVEIQTSRADGVLAVPNEAVRVEDGQEVCYVTRGDRIERREVTLGETTRDMLEVVDGLAEGEQVLLGPSDADVTGAESTGGGAPDFRG